MLIYYLTQMFVAHNCFEISIKQNWLLLLIVNSEEDSEPFNNIFTSKMFTSDLLGIESSLVADFQYILFLRSDRSNFTFFVN